MQFANTEKK